jgi:hypothetical protein
VPAAGGVGELLDGARAGEFGCPVSSLAILSLLIWIKGERNALLQLRETLHLERAAQELLLPLLRVVDVLVGPVAAVPDALAVGALLGDVHPEVAQENRDLLQVGVLVPHMRQLDQLDLLRGIDATRLAPFGEAGAAGGGGVLDVVGDLGAAGGGGFARGLAVCRWCGHGWWCVGGV